jgi:hypothetical protein
MIRWETWKKYFQYNGYYFFRKGLEVENVIWTSFAVSKKIVKYLNLYIGGKFFKKCSDTLVDTLCPYISDIMSTISPSHHAVTRPITLAANLEQKLRDRASKF